jgi:hypothetical protein
MSRHVDKLEKNVQFSRERLFETVDELRSRLHPSNLLQDGSASLADTAPAHFLANLKADVLRNPVPVALLGVAVAWLASADRKVQEPLTIAKYAVTWRWRARRLAQIVQQNASNSVSTALAAKSAAGELQQSAAIASTKLSNQLSGAPNQAREMGQSLAKSTRTRANAVGDLTRNHSLLVGTAAAGLAASVVGLTLLYRRYAAELDAARQLVRVSEQEPESQSKRKMVSVDEAHATLVPQKGLSTDKPVTSAVGQESHPGFVE